MLRGFLWLTAACGFVLSLMVLLCSEAGAAFLLYALERQSAPVEARQLREVQAVVVLSGTIERVHYGASLHRQTGLPLLLTGKGGGDARFPAESMTLDEILRTQHGIAPRWLEVESVDTVQNALYSWCILAPAGIRRVALVTDPFHIPRSRALFESVGFTVVAAPDMDAPPRLPPIALTIDSFVPSGAGLDAARFPLKEWTGTMLAPIAVALRRGECGPKPAMH